MGTHGKISLIKDITVLIKTDILDNAILKFLLA